MTNGKLYAIIFVELPNGGGRFLLEEEVKVSFTFLLIMEGGMSVNNYITFEMLMDFCTLLVAIIALFVGIYNKKR